MQSLPGKATVYNVATYMRQASMRIRTSVKLKKKIAPSESKRSVAAIFSGNMQATSVWPSKWCLNVATVVACVPSSDYKCTVLILYNVGTIANQSAVLGELSCLLSDLKMR